MTYPSILFFTQQNHTELLYDLDAYEKFIFSQINLESMQYRLLDILADPDNPDHWPLSIKILLSKEEERENNPIPHQETGLYCKFYCSRKQKYLVSNPLSDNEHVLPPEQLSEIATISDCNKCFEEEIIDAIIFHDYGNVRKFFIVDREIPVMYPLELRDKKQERAFYNRYPDAFKELGLDDYFKIDE